MERRLAKISVSSAGGTASVGSKTYKISLPSSWLSKIGIHENQRQVELCFDGEKITIAPILSVDDFAESKVYAGHKLYEFRYYDADNLSTLIYADFTDKCIRHKDYITDPVKTAFGRNTLPTWRDFESFLEERCIPRGRSGLREYLEELGLDSYEPFEIILKTKGRMAEDQQWLEVRKL